MTPSLQCVDRVDRVKRHRRQFNQMLRETEDPHVRRQLADSWPDFLHRCETEDQIVALARELGHWPSRQEAACLPPVPRDSFPIFSVVSGR